MRHGAITIVLALLVGGCTAARTPSLAKTGGAHGEVGRFRATMIHDGATPELADWQAWITFYYTNPRPDRTIAAIRFLERRGDLLKNPTPIGAFFGRLFAQNPTAVPGWIDELRRDPEDTRFFTALALWFSRLEDRDALLARLSDGASPRVVRYAAGLRSDIAPDLTTIDARSPVELDMLWGSFFATGDTRFIERIIAVIPPATAPDGAPASDGATAPERAQVLVAAARWSLTVNAGAHSAVLEFCRQQAAQQPERAAVLTDIVTKAVR